MVALPPETPFTLQAKLAPGLPISSTENCRVEFTRRTAPGGLIAIGPITRKAVGEVAEPRGAVTVMGPLVSPDLRPSWSHEWTHHGDGALVGADERDRDWIRETRGIDPIDSEKIANQ